MRSSPALRDRLASLIAARREEMIADLARHVAIPTGRNHTPGLDTYRAILVARLDALGATPHYCPGDARPDWLSETADGPPKHFDSPPTVLCRRLTPGKPRILLAGHLDTVFDPRGPFQTLSLSSDGRTAIGPGVVDMKGGILIALVALEALESMCVPVSWSFILNSDEETGSYASDRALRAAAKEHDLGLALEPALPDGGLAVERKGSAQFLIEAFGTSAHAGRDFEKGASAVYALARAITRCEAMTDLPRGLTVNIGPLKGGAATNIVPDYAAAWGNVRFKDAASACDIEQRLSALDASQGLPRLRVHTSFARPAKPLTPETQRLADTIRDVAESLGQSLPFGASGGVCDGNNLQDAGLPTLDTLGVRGGGLHTHQEWIDLASLTERATLLACLLAELST
jgi:glutamate carboxypeptidase